MSKQHEFERDYADASNAIAELLTHYKRMKQRRRNAPHNHSRLPSPIQRRTPIRESWYWQDRFIIRDQPAQRLFSLPTELKDKIVLEIEEHDLASLAQTCWFMASFTEEYRYHEVVIRSPSALASIRSSLSNSTVDRLGRTRAQRLRDLSLAWTTAPTSPATAADLRWVLEHVPHAVSLSLDIPTPEGHSTPRFYEFTANAISLGCLSSVRTLSTTDSMVRFLRRPTPMLTHLSVDLVDGLDTGILTTISRTFGDTLERLRLFRYFSHGYGKQSPARVCDGLIAPRLEYLEIWDEATTDETGLDTVDFIADNPLLCMHAKAGVPALKILTWAPAWKLAYSSHSVRFEASLKAFQCHLLAILEPILLGICVNYTHAVLAWSKEDGCRYRAPDLVTVDREAWCRA